MRVMSAAIARGLPFERPSMTRSHEREPVGQGARAPAAGGGAGRSSVRPTVGLVGEGDGARGLTGEGVVDDEGAGLAGHGRRSIARPAAACRQGAMAASPARYRPVAVRARDSLPGSPSNTMRPPCLAGLGPELDHPVGARDDVGVVLDDDQRVPAGHESLEHAQQPLDVRQVQARRGLVEHVHGGLVGAAGRELGRELEPLRLAARRACSSPGRSGRSRRRGRSASRADARCGGGWRTAAPRPAPEGATRSPIDSPA